ncbi:MAG: 50S ribosomal protein L29 [Candidatus Yanofskybacteria bacterium]|nr:50S ribosomal protein L29 [Candidatus Yanofskybacteria bacterium]
MKLAELKNKTSKELTSILQEHKIQLSKLGFELEANTLKDTSQVKKTKKEIARILTLLKNK